MKTAKEMCEFVQNKKIEYWINQLEINNGKISIGEGLDEKILQKLKELGYKITPYVERVYIGEMGVYKEKTVSFFGLFPKKIQERIGSEPTYREYNCIEISACCGEENESN